MKSHSKPCLPLARVALCAVLLLVLPAGTRGQEPAGAKQSAIAGTVLDDETGEPVIDAGIELIGQKKQARTDIDGKFRIPVPPGRYEIRIFAAGYQSTRITNVEVKADLPSDVEAVLEPAGEEGIQVVEVIATAKKSTETAQIIKRQTADVVEDTISAETFQKAPDSNAGEVVARVAAVTVENDFVFVRGLGERYSSALLDRSRLPSPDPNKRVIPLDFFPADFLDSLAIIKSYSPDLPGDFSGGLIDINLLDAPEELTWKVGTKLGFNTNSTFQDFKTYKTAREAPNFFGVDTTRELPSIFGNERVVFQNQQEAAMFAAALRNIWSSDTITAPPNTGIELEVGDTWGPFSLAFAGTWENSYEVLPDEIERQFINAGGDGPTMPEIAEDFVYQRSIFGTELGGLLTSEYDLGESGRLNVRGLYQRLTADQVLEGEGFRRQNPDVNLNTTRLEYQEESLTFGQLSGEHKVEGLEILWRSAVGEVEMDRPDTRTTVYESSADTPTPQYARTAGSGTRLFYNINELMSDSQADVIFPFKTGLPFTDVWDGLAASFKMGGAFTWRDRESELRKFLFRPRRTDDQAFLQQRPELILNSANVEDGTVDFIEETTDQDSFTASEQIIAGYGMVELPLVPDAFRFIGGVRVENSVIDLTYFRQDEQGAPTDRTLINLDPLPSAALVWTPRSDMSVRTSYSQTVSRPEFRELSPIQFPEPLGLRPVIGNPDLVESHIDNFDLRWDWFFAPPELASMSFFYKNLDKPIETVLRTLSGTTATSFANSDSAWLLGLEWELRKNFGFASDSLRDLVLLLNASWITSESTRGDQGQGEIQTTTQGPLQGQAPFTVNAALQYSYPDWGTARLIYNTIGQTLSDFGESGLPDILEESRNSVDFTYSNQFAVFGLPINAKLAAENILNDAYLWTQSSIVQQEYRSGVTFSISLSYRY